MQVSPSSASMLAFARPAQSRGAEIARQAANSATSAFDRAGPARSAPATTRSTPAPAITPESRAEPVGPPAIPLNQAAPRAQYTQQDLQNLLDAWGASPGEERFAAAYDLNADGRINAQDLNQLLGSFAPEPPAKAQDPAPPGFEDVDDLMKIWGARAGDADFSERLDVNQDGYIGSQDLNELLGRYESPDPTAGAERSSRDKLDSLLSAWGSRPGDAGFDPTLDFDGDGVITARDLHQLLGEWEG